MDGHNSNSNVALFCYACKSNSTEARPHRNAKQIMIHMQGMIATMLQDYRTDFPRLPPQLPTLRTLRFQTHLKTAPSQDYYSNAVFPDYPPPPGNRLFQKDTLDTEWRQHLLLTHISAHHIINSSNNTLTPTRYNSCKTWTFKLINKTRMYWNRLFI